MTARRTTRKPADQTDDQHDDPIDNALLGEREGVADDLSALLTELTGTTQGDIQVIIYHVPNASGKWQYIKEVQPPIDMPALMEELKADYGGGAFQLRVRVAGKIKTTRSFEIAKTKASPFAVAPKDNGDNMLQLILAQNASSKSDMMAMFQMMQSQQQQSTNTMMALVTAIIAKPSDNPLAILPSLLETMKPKEGGGMGETLVMLKTAKELFSEGGGGGDGDTSLMGMAAKVLPGILEGAASLAKNRAPVETAQPAQQLRTVPMPQPQAAPVAQLTAQPGEELSGPDKLLSLIGPDVVFCYQRGHSPEMAADMALELIDKHAVEQHELIALVVQVQGWGEQWAAELASRGLDFSANPQWFSDFVTAVVGAYQEDDDTGGDGGGEKNAGDNGDPGQTGETKSAGASESD